MRLTADRLGWTAGPRAILQDVSLEIAPGETFGLIGPNGSGKSSLLRRLAGLLPKGQGAVHLDGQPMARMSRRQIAQSIAFVEQQAETTEALTARDTVELGRTPWLSALRPFGPEDSAIVADALQAVGASHLAGARWSTLSGGERQRVQIARALAQRPRLLLLDEPTNHLDIHHQLALLRLVHRLPVTVVLALHDLNQALDCDRLGVMEGGRMVAIGPPQAVLTPARLAQIFRVGARPLTDPADGRMVLRFHGLPEAAD